MDAPSNCIINSWEPLNLEKVLRGEKISPAPTVFSRDDGVHLLYPMRLNSLFGESESLKSWIALLATAQEVCLGNHVLFVDYEDAPETAVDRLKSFGVPDESIENLFTYIRPSETFSALAEAIINDLIIERGGPTLVVIDGVTEAMTQSGLEPNDGGDVVRFYSGFPKWFARKGAAVLMIDHVTKSNEGRGRWAIGSERKISGIDGAAYKIELIDPFGRGRVGKAKITVSKDRCGFVRQFTGPKGLVALVELDSTIEGRIKPSLKAPSDSEPTLSNLTEVMEQLSQAITDYPGINVNSLRKQVRCKNVVKDAALRRLVLDGYVEVRTGPNRSKIHTSIRPFAASDKGADNVLPQ